MSLVDKSGSLYRVYTVYLPHLFSLRWCGDFVSSAIIILYLLVNGIRFAFTNGERE